MSIIIIAVDLLEVVVLTLHEFEKCVNDYIPVNVDFVTTCFSEPNKFFLVSVFCLFRKDRLSPFTN